MRIHRVIAASLGCVAFISAASADIVYLAQTRTISVTTMADGNTSSQSSPNFSTFNATVAHSVPGTIQGVTGINAGTTDISCHFDRNVISTRTRMTAQGVVGQSQQLTATTTTLVDVTFQNTATSSFRLLISGADVAEMGINQVFLRLTSLDDSSILFDLQDTNLADNLFGNMPSGTYRFEFMAEQTSNIGQCGRNYELSLSAPATPCVADIDDGTFSGTPDGGVTIDDLLFYLYVFELGDIRADLDDGTGRGHPDNAVTIDDLLFFIDHFQGGC